MSTTSPSPQGSLVAPMFVLLGPVFALGASFVASDGVPQALVHEAGMLAFVATAVCFVVTFVVAGLVFMASRGRSWAAVVALPLALLPWAVMVLAMVLGADLVASAVRSADPSTGVTLVAMGTSEVMASRMLGASFAFGSALALTLAMLVLALAEPVEGRSRVPGSAYTVLLLVVVTGTALAALADATVLRHGLAAMSSLDFEARVAVLS